MKIDIKGNNLKQIQIIIIFALSILLYANTWNFEFASDDTMMITENNFTKGGKESLKKIFTTDAFAGFLGEGKNLLSGGRYRPLSQVIFNIEYSLFGMNPMLWHIQNTLFFAFAMVLVYLTLLKLFQNTKTNPKALEWHNLAFITTIIAATHPLNTEVVANIKSFDLLLSLIFSFTALYSAIKYYDSPNSKSLIIVFASLFLGTLSKETSLTFLGVIPLALLFFRKLQIRKFISIFAMSAMSIITYFAFRVSLVGMPKSMEVKELLNNPFVDATFSEKYATIIYTWWHYIELYIFPNNLTHDYYPYTIAITQWGNPLTILALLIFSGMSFWSLIKLYKTVFRNQKSNYVAFGWLFFVLIFSISSNLFVSIGAFMNERFIFIADIGWAIILAYGILFLGRKFKLSKSVILIISFAIAGLFSIKTYVRNYAWENDYTLFTTDVKVSKNSAKCNVSAGGKSYEKAKESQGFEKKRLLNNAERYLKHGIEIHPKYAQAYILLGNVYFEKEDFAQAFNTYKQSVKIGERKDSKTNLLALGMKCNKEKKYKLSTNILNYYLKTFGYNSDAHYYTAYNTLELGNKQKAIEILDKLIKTDSTYAEAYNKMGEIYGRYLNNLQASEYYLNRGYHFDPKNASICENLGVLNGIKGNVEESIFFFEKAIENSEKPSKQLYSNLAATYQRAGMNAKAEAILKLVKK